MAVAGRVVFSPLFARLGAFRALGRPADAPGARTPPDGLQGRSEGDPYIDMKGDGYGNPGRRGTLTPTSLSCTIITPERIGTAFPNLSGNQSEFRILRDTPREGSRTEMGQGSVGGSTVP